MTNPPPPGNWGPPQPGWGPPAPPPNSSLKWLLVGVAVLLVIAISVGATLLFTRDGDGSTQTATGNSPTPSEFASANDTGPVTVITEDPTCEPWRPIASTLSDQQDRGWKQRDIAVPATMWNDEQRTIHESVAEAMRNAADETVALVKLTPHRVVRELYEQSIAYWRAYADSIPTYSEIDNELAKVANATANTLVSLCTAIDQKSASARGPLVPAIDSPTSPILSTDPSNPDMFITSTSTSQCNTWNQLQLNFERDASPWVNIDPKISASGWTTEQRSSMEVMSRLMSKYADELEAAGTRSGNAVFEDFARLSAVYWRAFVESIPTYNPSDSYLSGTASSAGFIAFNGCAAVGR